MIHAARTFPPYSRAFAPACPFHHLLFREFVFLRVHRDRSGPECAHFVPRIFAHGRIQAGNPVVLDGRCQVRVAQRHLHVAVAEVLPNRHQRDALHHELTGESVPQIVQPERLRPRNVLFRLTRRATPGENTRPKH